MAEKKRGRPPTGKAVPVTERVKKVRQKQKAAGLKRVELYLDPLSADALDRCHAANRSVTKSQLVGLLLQREAEALKLF